MSDIGGQRYPDGSGEARLDCIQRVKNLPDRHFSSVKMLVWQQFT